MYFCVAVCKMLAQVNPCTHQEEKTMKKIIAVILAVLMLSFIAGCSKNNDTSGTAAATTAGGEVSTTSEKDAVQTKDIPKDEIEVVSEGNRNDDYTYTLFNNNTCELSGYSGSNRKLELPAIIGDAPVVSIGSYAFANKTSLEEIVIPESIENICYAAFQYCEKLTTVSIPATLESVEDFAFFGCSAISDITVAKESKNYTVDNGMLYEESTGRLVQFAAADTSVTSVTLPSDTKEICAGAFSDAVSLTSVSIPASVTKIGASAFKGCDALTSVSIPDAVTEVGEKAFYGCDALTSVNIGSGATLGTDALAYCVSLSSIGVNAGNPNYSSSNGVLLNAAGNELVLFPIGKTDGYKIPTAVKKISDNAFYGCYRLTTISYAGSTAQWRSVSQGTGNSVLTVIPVVASDGTLNG